MLAAIALRPENPTREAILLALKALDARLALQGSMFGGGSAVGR